jgi:WD40 repeat protein
VSGTNTKNPFPGPQPYRASDRDRFYGREELSYRLEDNVIANRCVTVYGPSGAGKTSVMQASVLPRLVESREISVVRVDSWPEAEAPSRWLASAIYDQLGFGAVPEDLSPDEAIEAAAKRVARRSSRLLVVYLDQMEQLLYASRSPAETDAFFECVHALVELPLRNVRVVLSLREDYLGRFRDRLREFDRLLSHGFRVGPLTVGELCEAVCKAAATGEPPQTWQTDEMRVLMLQMRVAGQAESDEAEGQAAYAQIVCRALFDVRAGGDATAGGAKAEPILRGYFDKTLGDLGPLRASAERLLEDHLITADGTRTLRTEKELLRILPAKKLSPVLKALEGAAILHAEEHQGSRYFEIGHDWLAKRVHEQRAAREREEELLRREKEQQEELARERRKRRNLRIITGISLTLGSLAFYGRHEAERARKQADEETKKADKAQTAAHDARIMSGYRELEARGQLGWAMKLLPKAVHPKRRWDWVALASEALNESALKATLIGHNGPLSVAVWSPKADDKRILTASTDGTARVWSDDGEGDPLELALKEHHGAVLTAGWSLDGKRVVTGTEDGTVCVWNVDVEGPRGTPTCYKGQPGPVASMAVSPDGGRVLTVLMDGTARVWSVDAPDNPIALGGDKDQITTAIFHPDGIRVITVSSDGTARLRSGEGLRKVVEFKAPGARVVFVTASPDGGRIVTASQDNTASIWSADGKGNPIVLKGHYSAIYHAAVSPDNNYVATASRDGTARVWGMDGTVKIVLPHAQAVTFVAFWPLDGKYLATVSMDKIVRVFATDGIGTPLELRGHDTWIRSVAWRPDGVRLVTAASDPNNASIDKTAKVWSAESLSSIPRTQQGGRHFHSAFISVDGQHVVSAYDDDIARLWRRDGSRAPIKFKGHKGWVANAALSPDGKRVVTASFDKTARIWDVADETEIKTLKGHDDAVRFAAFSPDGMRVVTVSDDKTARVWNVNGSEDPVVLKSHENGKGHEDGLTSAAWSPDGQQIVTTSLDHTARVWNANDGEARCVFRDHLNDVLSATWSPDGKRIVTTSKDRTARVWSADCTSTPIVWIHPDTVLAAAWSPKPPDSKPPDSTPRIATSTPENTVRIWNADGKGSPIVLTVPAPVIAMQFRDEQSIVTVDEENTAKTWRIDINELRERLPKTDTDCLPPQVLVRILGASSDDAKFAYAECERLHHRTLYPLLEGL